jgi:hypothetical protein
VKDEQKNPEKGMDAKTTMPKGDDDTFDGKTKKTAKRTSFEDSATMYPTSDHTYVKKAKSSASIAPSVAYSCAGVSFAGKSVAQDGRTVSSKACTVPGFENTPVMMHAIDKKVGGNLILSQVDGWDDNSCNKRASVHIIISPGAILGENEVSLRVSTTNPTMLVIHLKITPDFANPNKKLAHYLPKIAQAYDIPMRGSWKQKALHILRQTPRYIECCKTLKAFLGSKSKFVLEVRVKCPFAIDDNPVTIEEDNIFYGSDVVSKSSGTNLFIELKEKGKTFKPVKMNGLVDDATVVGSPGGFFTPVKSGSIPFNINIPISSKPRRTDEDDDDSTIPSDESSVVIAEEVSDNDDAMSVIAEEGSDDDDDSQCTKLTLQLSRLLKKMETAKHARKKSKVVAASSTASIGSHTTRGTEDSEAKRKSPKNSSSAAASVASKKSNKSKESKKKAE